MLVRVISVVFVVAVVALGGFYAWAWHGEIAPVRTADRATYDPAIVAKGAGLAAIGSCVVCHTQAGGQAFAGGYPVETPFGTVYGSNITPDAETGIGSWSQAAFRRAMHDGVTRKGEHLYPAFPYDHFTHTIGRVVAAVDSGQAVNPDGIRNQIEGAIVQSASWTLLEEVTFSQNAITSRDWSSYPILRFPDVPESVDVHVIDRPDQPFLGTGEAGQGPAAAAIANAVAHAAGVRLRDLPLTPARVKAAIGV